MLLKLKKKLPKSFNILFVTESNNKYKISFEYLGIKDSIYLSKPNKYESEEKIINKTIKEIMCSVYMQKNDYKNALYYFKKEN